MIYSMASPTPVWVRKASPSRLSVVVYKTFATGDRPTSSHADWDFIVRQPGLSA